MEDRTHAVVAAAFLILVTAGGVFVFWWLQSGTPQVKDYVIVSSRSASGLGVDAPVKYKGVKVGSVRSVKLDPDDPHKVRIQISLVAEAPVTHATYAQLSTKGITGLKYVALKDGSGARTPLQGSRKHPPRIPLRPGLVGKLEQSGETLLKQTDALSKRLNDLLDADNRAHVAHILGNLDTATGHLVALEKAAMPTLKALPQVADEARRTLERSQSLLSEVRKDARAVHALSRSANDVTEKVRNDTLPRLDRLSRHFDHTLDGVNSLTRELRRHPRSVLFGRPPARPGPGEPGFQPPAKGDAQ